jgi:hypothetical protein
LFAAAVFKFPPVTALYSPLDVLWLPPVTADRYPLARFAYAPHPGQLLVHRSRASRRVLACGTRFGKSTCAAMEAVAALMEPRDPALGWLVSGTYDLTDRIFKRVVQAIESHFPHRIKLFDPRNHRLVVINFGGGESELRAKSADRPQSLLGEALDFLVVDECASMRDDTWNECLAPRLIDRNGWALLILILGDDEEPERCTACGHIIDKRGKTLLGVGEDGHPRSLVMRCEPTRLTEQELRNLQDWNGSRQLR